MFKRLLASLGVAAVLLSGLNLSWANDLDREYQFSYGNLEGKTRSQITLLEYDYNTGEENIISYVIDNKTELDGIDGLKELQEGDSLEIFYIFDQGKKRARFILRSAGETEYLDEYEIGRFK